LPVCPYGYHNFTVPSPSIEAFDLGSPWSRTKATTNQLFDSILAMPVQNRLLDYRRILEQKEAVRIEKLARFVFVFIFVFILALAFGSLSLLVSLPRPCILPLAAPISTHHRKYFTLPRLFTSMISS
jgi:hypothetical protein